MFSIKVIDFFSEWEKLCPLNKSLAGTVGKVKWCRIGVRNNEHFPPMMSLLKASQLS